MKKNAWMVSVIGTALSLPLAAMACDQGEVQDERPSDFVSLAEVDSSIPVLGVYADDNNFLGEEVEGYDSAVCLLTQPAAEALASAQKQLQGSGLTLVVFDCYRPQQAVDHFMEWVEDEPDVDDDDDAGYLVDKKRYYPNLSRQQLKEQAYIAECSGHTRGSTVDLTITYAPGADSSFDYSHLVGCDASFDGIPKGLDMGTGFDCFDPASNTERKGLPFHALENRRMLKRLMEAAGFKNYEREWWHYSLRNEPYQELRFDFLVE